jgi:hypothetical protein
MKRLLSTNLSNNNINNLNPNWITGFCDAKRKLTNNNKEIVL